MTPGVELQVDGITKVVTKVIISKPMTLSTGSRKMLVNRFEVYLLEKKHISRIIGFYMELDKYLVVLFVTVGTHVDNMVHVAVIL